MYVRPWVCTIYVGPAKDCLSSGALTFVDNLITIANGKSWEFINPWKLKQVRLTASYGLLSGAAEGTQNDPCIRIAGTVNPTVFPTYSDSKEIDTTNSLAWLRHTKALRMLVRSSLSALLTAAEWHGTLPKIPGPSLSDVWITACW